MKILQDDNLIMKFNPFNNENPVTSRAGKHANHNRDGIAGTETLSHVPVPGKNGMETPRDIAQIS